MRVVLDTNIVASALLWGDVPRLLLHAGREKRLDLFSSTPLLAELTDILNRRKFEKKIAGMSEGAPATRPANTPLPRAVGRRKL